MCVERTFLLQKIMNDASQFCIPILKITHVAECLIRAKLEIHSNLDLGVVLVSRELTPKSREILN